MEELKDILYKLPEEIQLLILSYIMKCNNIKFKKFLNNNQYSENNDEYYDDYYYFNKYKMSYYTNKFNKENKICRKLYKYNRGNTYKKYIYLSCLKKKNKYCYFLIIKNITIEYDYSHRDIHDCSPDKNVDVCCTSKYIGKNIIDALFYYMYY
jgi:hypothetical protein